LVLSQAAIFSDIGQAQENVYFNCNSEFGVWAQGGSALALGPVDGPHNRTVTIGNNASGLYVELLAVASLSRVWFRNNATGMWADFDGVIKIGVNLTPTLANDNTTDGLATNRGAIMGMASAYGGQVLTVNPANGTLGNNQGYINIT
jgi:hypothetical protein